jgi:hypothetical protein
LHKLEIAGGLTMQRYQELVAAADQSAHDSPAALAKAQFEKDWELGPNELAERVREEIATRSV